MKKTSIFILLLCFFSNLFSQNQTLRNEDFIYKNNIKTVIFRLAGTMFDKPIIRLNSGDILDLQFDDMDSEGKTYSFTVFHCNADWSTSDLNYMEYLDGFPESYVYQYDMSFNTIVKYNHYSFSFPNQDLKPKISGNYILMVYEDNDKNNIVLTRRFWIVDNKIEIKGKVTKSRIVKSITTSQEISFSFSSDFIQNPFDNLYVCVAQNNRQDNINCGITPTYIKGNELIYDKPGDILFPGGNEYRFFNIKNHEYAIGRIESISFENPNYRYKLFPDIEEASRPYTYRQDINGERLITADNTENADLEADYAFADFELQYKNPELKGDFYVFGALSDWNISDEFKMKYDIESKSYKTSLLLKQGFYNYEYVFVKNGSSVFENSQVEGCHYETENKYTIFVYYRFPGKVYDELIGVRSYNSQKKL